MNSNPCFQIDREQARAKVVESYKINDWIAHNVSKRIVEIAKENKAMIAMENLKVLHPVKGKNSRKNNRMIGNWVRGRVVKYTIYKAKWEGIRVKLVNAKNTSKTCHLCARFENRCIFLLRILPTHL